MQIEQTSWKVNTSTSQPQACPTYSVGLRRWDHQQSSWYDTCLYAGHFSSQYLVDAGMIPWVTYSIGNLLTSWPSFSVWRALFYGICWYRFSSRTETAYSNTKYRWYVSQMEVCRPQTSYLNMRRHFLVRKANLTVPSVTVNLWRPDNRISCHFDRWFLWIY